LDYFLQHGAMTVVTTHHSTIKTFAMSMPHITCATVAFDPDTLQPRYRLIYGFPGRSQAFMIAAKLGVPDSVIARAQHEVGIAHRRSEQLLARLESQQLAVEAERERLHVEHAETTRLWEEARQVLAGAKAEEQRVRQHLHMEGQALLKSVRQDLDVTLATLRQQVPAGQPLAFPQSAWQQAEQAIASLAMVPEEVGPSTPPFQTGDHVRVRGLNIVGRVLSAVAAHGNVQVEVGNKTLTVAATELDRVVDESLETPQRSGGRLGHGRRRRAASEASLASELRLMGSTVDEALPAVEQYLDRANLQGISRVRIVHGIGSGRLREAIREFLQHHPLVRGFQAGDVGGGTTIVELEG
jgi:DNA mismatch repair protein MutS2